MENKTPAAFCLMPPEKQLGWAPDGESGGPCQALALGTGMHSNVQATLRSPRTGAALLQQSLAEKDLALSWPRLCQLPRRASCRPKKLLAVPELARGSRLEFPKAGGVCGCDRERPSAPVGKIEVKREVPTLESGQPLMPLISRTKDRAKKGRMASSASSTGGPGTPRCPASRSEGLESGGIQRFLGEFVLYFVPAVLSESEVGEAPPLSLEKEPAWLGTVPTAA